MAAQTEAAMVEAVGGYRDRVGCERRVLVRRPAADRYEVLDVGAGGEPRLVETLTGVQESPATAAAVARDYLEQQRRQVAAVRSA